MTTADRVSYVYACVLGIVAMSGTMVRDRFVRPVLLAAGFASVGLAFAGLFIPLLPTTPFVLLASACFARSSPRFERWLLQHRWFGPPLSSWREHRALPRRTKWTMLALLWVTMGLSLALAPLSWPARAGLALVLVMATVFLARVRVVKTATAESHSSLDAPPIG